MTSYDEFDSVWAPADTAVDDRGGEHRRVQNAVDNAENFVMIGPGLYEESVVVSGNDGLSIRGAGRGTRIRAEDTQAIEVEDSDDVDIEQLAASTVPQTGNHEAILVGLNSTGANMRLVQVLESDQKGIRVVGENASIVGCIVDETSAAAFNLTGSCRDSTVTGCVAQDGVSGAGFDINGARHAVGLNIADSVGQEGIDSNCEDSGFGVNVIGSPGADGVLDEGTDNNWVGNVVTNPTGDHFNFSAATGHEAVGNVPSENNVVSQVQFRPRDVLSISSPSRGSEAYHDPSVNNDGNTEGPCFYNGADWISKVDNSTIS